MLWGHRWLADLSDFQFEIFYKPDKLNRDADGLSRRPNPELEQAECTQTISHEVFKELCSIVTNVEEFAGVAESVPVDSTVLVNSVDCSTWVQCGLGSGTASRPRSGKSCLTCGKW